MKSNNQQSISGRNNATTKAWIKAVFLIVAFSLLIILTLSVSKPVFYSSVLILRVTGNKREYVDKNGTIRFASDKGYASVKMGTDSEGNVILEEYFDENENLTVLPAGYNKIKRKYENGRNTIITYLDKNDIPVVINNGYDSIHRKYDDANQTEIDTYFIGNTQVKRQQGYWQCQRLYENGKIYEIRYLDQNGALMNNNSGYAILRRTYTDNGRIDFYYDSEGKPTALSLGQYGKMIEGNTTTYLNQNGEATNTNRGYAIIRDINNKQLYYDADGNPTTIGKKQYGVENINGKRFFLNEEGEQIFRLDNILSTHPIIVLLFGILSLFLALILRGKGNALFLIAYAIFVVYMTIIYREPGNSRGQFELFSSYRQFFSSKITQKNILLNIWLFVPLGAILSQRDYQGRIKEGWIWAIAFSIIIETIQYLAGIGCADIDDVFSNGLGGLLGYELASMVRILTRHIVSFLKPIEKDGKAL